MNKVDITLENMDEFLASLAPLQEISTVHQVCVYAYRVNPLSLQLYVGISSCLFRRDMQHRQKRIRRDAKLSLLLLPDPLRLFEDEDAVTDRLSYLIGADYVTGGGRAIHRGPGAETCEYEERIRRNLCVLCGQAGHYISQCTNYVAATQAQLKADAMGAGQRLYGINANALYNFATTTFEKIVVELARFCTVMHRYSLRFENSCSVDEEILQLADLAHAAKRAGIKFGRSCETFPGLWMNVLSLPDRTPHSAPEHHSLAVREAAAGAAVIEMRRQGRAQYNRGAALANYIVVLVIQNVCHPSLAHEEWATLRHFVNLARRRELGQPNGRRSHVLLPLVR